CGYTSYSLYFFSPCLCLSLLPPPPTSTLFPYTTLFRSLDEHPDFLRGVDPLELGGRTPDPQQPDDAVGAPVEQSRERQRDPGEQDQRRRDPAARTLRIGDGPGLGRLLAEHDMQERDEGHRHHRRDAPAGEEVKERGERGEPVAEQVRHGVFGHVAQEDRGDGDAELRRRQLAVEILQRRLHGLSLPVAAPRQGIDAR